MIRLPDNLNLLQQLMDHMTDNIFFKDRDHRFIMINQANARWFGFEDPQEAIGKSDFDLFDEAFARQAYEDEERIMATGSPMLGDEEQTDHDGEKVWGHVTKIPLRDNAGQIIGIIGIGRDITALKRKEIELFISRFRAKARLANMVQSRVKTLAKMEKKDKLEQMKGLEFSFRSKPFKAKQVFTVENLSYAWGANRPLFENLDFSILSGERICIVGKNGKGKLSPVSGKITYNPQVESGVFEQTNIQSLVDNRTVEEEILYAQPDVDRQKARNICGSMMFEGDSALKKISVLSGGEKSRVMLGKLLVTPVNLLMLDEPTNHLDMDACDALLAAIDNFDGALIMVTHNEMFLHALADRLIVFDDAGARLFDGSYQDFLNKGGWGDGAAMSRRQDEVLQETVPAAPRFNKKELRRLRSEIITEKSKVLKPMEDAITKAEAEIETNETLLDQLNQEMVEASEQGDGDRIAPLSQQIRSCQDIIETRFAEMEKMDDQRQRLEKKFEKRLSALDA